MKEFLDHLDDRMRKLMDGRYGVDDFSKCLITVTLILFILSLFIRRKILFLIAVIVLVYAWYRMLSMDRERRIKENTVYQKCLKIGKQILIDQKHRIDGTRDFCFFKCPGCDQEVRVPRGKGHIRITCPRCHTQFDRTV